MMGNCAWFGGVSADGIPREKDRRERERERDRTRERE